MIKLWHFFINIHNTTYTSCAHMTGIGECPGQSAKCTYYIPVGSACMCYQASSESLGL